ncbi:ParB/RepB/Spo0J family partition protein [Rubeoparvulum massiliense]|uniref:ParB/RepB/Spo0J family partition protein n=1 Tax=Rubeoparvulum massiliense TaxID=1631346 RepID=UPI00065E4B94|nr:ParB/RepB/Spo0J family partition protein [Rubeoparvulum massiliense]
MSKRLTGLGRGLDALLPSIEDEHVIDVKIDELRPNPYQPRKHFTQDAIEQLATSIKEHGVIQPLIVRKSIKGYEIVAGERRWRASRQAGLSTVPAIVKDLDDRKMVEIALIENLQREDLNAIEIAEAYQQYMKQFALKQDEVAQRVGVSRSHVANYLRLLQLPLVIQEALAANKLTMGHAKALAGIKDEQVLVKMADRCIEEGWTVRICEEIVQQFIADVPRGTKNKKAKKESKDVFVKDLEEQLRNYFGTSVLIRQGKKHGKIEIQYYSQEDLSRILQLLQKD